MMTDVDNLQSSPCRYKKENSWSEWHCTAEGLWQQSVKIKRKKYIKTVYGTKFHLKQFNGLKSNYFHNVDRGDCITRLESNSERSSLPATVLETFPNVP